MIAEVRERLAGPLPRARRPRRPEPEFEPNMPREAFEAMVARIIEYVHAGDAFQVVPSQRWSAVVPSTRSRSTAGCAPSTRRPTCTSSTSRTSRSSARHPSRWSPSPAGARPRGRSPGTRPRGGAVDEDKAIAEDLLADEKERAEHVMLVDLGRNDLGRVCEYGSVEVEAFMARRDLLAPDPHRLLRWRACARRRRRGRAALLLPGRDAVRRPEGRAMEIIDELEPVKRGPTAARSATSPTRASSTPASASAPWWSRTASPTCRPAAAPWPTPSPTTSTRSRATRRARSARAIELAGASMRRPAPWPSRVLVVDNYDSFTYNLVQYLGELGAELGRAQRRRGRRRAARARRSRPRDRVARPVHPERGRRLGRGHAPLPEAGVPTLGRLPRPPVAGPGVRRAWWSATCPSTARRPRSPTTARGCSRACRRR